MSMWLMVSSAVWLGILTSISPCPLASNIAAISFISRGVGRTWHVLLSGLLYTLGRSVAYVGVAAIVVHSLYASDEVSRFLQRYLNQILGPVLIVVGMLLLGLFNATASLTLAGEGVQRRASGGGAHWALILGALFALSFCPVSAGLFFLSLIPLAAKAQSPLLVPTLYGVGTAVPVIAFAFIMAFASQSVGRAYNRLAQIERVVRLATGVIFVVVGIYYCLVHIYGISLPVFRLGA